MNYLQENYEISQVNKANICGTQIQILRDTNIKSPGQSSQVSGTPITNLRDTNKNLRNTHKNLRDIHQKFPDKY